MPIHDFSTWCRNRSLPNATVKVIQQIRESEPSRKVQSRGKNVSGFYPSQKMGVTIQFESHTLELAAIYEKEYDPDVLEYYDQPPAFKIRYQTKGRMHGHLYTPDFFVITSNWIGWEEWKTEEELLRLTLKNSNRYIQDEEGEWHCPPAEEYASQFGLGFKVRSSEEIDWIYQDNIRFLEDYLLQDHPYISDKAQDAIHSLVKKYPGMKLKELLDHAGNFDADDIYTLVATDQLYVNLEKNRLSEPQQVEVYFDMEMEKAYTSVTDSMNAEPDDLQTMVNLSVDEKIQWDGQGWKILNVGEHQVMLMNQDEKVIELPEHTLELLIKKGKIKGLNDTAQQLAKEEVSKRLQMASPQDFKKANHKFDVVQSWLEGETASQVSERTLRDWVKKFRDAERQFGTGYVGLLPARKDQGNWNRKLPEKTIELMQDLISNEYETIKQKSKQTVYNALVLACEEQELIPPSFPTFCAEVNQRPNYEQTKKRKGRRAAYNKETFYWALDMKTPRHGSRPFEICHIDHTELDVELISTETEKNLGRPWITFLIDAFSRRILALYLTFDPPSYRSCMMVIRECVKCHSRLPQTLIVDGGKEFHSVYFDSLLARYSCTKKQRPPAKARFGSVCERLFGVTNQRFIHNLAGNTQIMRNVRQVTKSVNPKNHAAWTLAELNERLCQWSYDVYDTIEHPAFGTTPREIYNNGMAMSGKRESRLIPYDETFRISTLPTTKKGTAKVIPSYGIKINYIYYWSEKLLNPQIEGTQINVRFDPYNIGVAYAFVGGHWVQLISEYYSSFVNHTEREIKLASEELRKRMNLYRLTTTITGKKLAEFIKSVEAQETLRI